MDGNPQKPFKRQHPDKTRPPTAKEDRGHHPLPQGLDQPVWVARHALVPRLESIMQALLDEDSTITVKRASSEDCPGTVLIDVTFGRK